MKKQLPLGLVLEGSSTHSPVLRLPRLAEDLGPIKSSAVRIARRFSNLIQGGYPVASYEELQSARLVLLRIPDAAVERVVSELCSSGLAMNRICFLLCETWLTSEVLAPLKERGAAVASLVRAPATERDYFIVEGQLSAARLARRFVEGHDGRAFEIKVASKHLFFAAEVLTTVLPLSLLSAAQKSLRAAGLAGNELAALLESMAQKMVREASHGIRLPLSNLPADCPPALAAQFMSQLQLEEPRLASFLEQRLDASGKLIDEAWKNATAGD